MANLSDIDRYTGRTAWLNDVPAAAYEEAKRRGMPGGCVSSAGRTYNEQAALYADYKMGKIKSASHPASPTAYHVKGDAIDLNEPARSWMRTHGATLGFRKDTVKGEPWHFVHDGKDRGFGKASEDEEMLIIAQIKGKPEVYVGNGVVRRHIPSPSALADLQWRIRVGQLKGNPDVQIVERIEWLGQLVK